MWHFTKISAKPPHFVGTPNNCWMIVNWEPEGQLFWYVFVTSYWWCQLQLLIVCYFLASIMKHGTGQSIACIGCTTVSTFMSMLEAMYNSDKHMHVFWKK